jgi:hypothetical protein
LDPRLAPDFLGIGAQKAGTTWLYKNLRCHPELFLPNEKELHYFDWNYDRSLRWYAHHFQAGTSRIKGEITPGYSILARERITFIHRLLPALRLVLLIRNPIERAWSQAMMNLVTLPGRSYEEVSRDEFLEHFRSPRSVLRGDYLNMIDNWLSVFDEDRLFVGLYDHIKLRPRELLGDVCKHLGVSTDVDWEQFPLHEVVHKGTGIAPPDSLRSVLQNMYRDDLKRLVARFGDRVAHWQ